MSTARPRLLKIAVPLLTVVGAIAIAEVALRFAGHAPYAYERDPNAPWLNLRVPDPELGWRNNPGTYVDPVHGHSVRIREDGSRATSADDRPATGPSVLLIGGSFMFGQAISDHETLAWMLQAQDPARQYRNYGVSGFGTVQSLLLLRRAIADRESPEWVVYGLIRHHKKRSAGSENWLKHLTQRPGQEAVTLPYASLADDGSLKLHPPARFEDWPLRRSSAILELIQNAYLTSRSRERVRDRQRITELAILEMREVCRAHGAELLVVLMEAEEASAPSPDARFLAEQGIPFVDGRAPLVGEYRQWDGHPSRAGNERWLAPVAATIARSPRAPSSSALP